MPDLPPGEHVALLEEALRVEAAGQRALLAGEDGAAAFGHAAELYARSYAAAPPASYGRLVGMLKAAILAGDARAAAGQTRAIAAGAAGPTAAYALALAALVEGRDADAAEQAAVMRAGGEAFARAAGAIEALAQRDAGAFAVELHGIVEDFAGRGTHLTGVAIADTAAMLDRLAAARGIAVRPQSPLMPPPGT